VEVGWIGVPSLIDGSATYLLRESSTGQDSDTSLTSPQSPAGSVLRQWTFSNLQVTDFVIHPDDARIIAITTSLKRVPIENKLKPSMSVRAAEPTRAGGSNPIPRDIGDDVAGVGGFGYGAMEHGIMVIRLADREIIE
jgi:hypothetical protein